MELEFTGEVVEWRGPAPHHFVAVPEPEASRIREVARLATYGWGCIPVSGSLGGSHFTTSLFPRDGGYLVPLKLAVRRREDVVLGDTVRLRIAIDV
jgi:hypothetical protein